MTEHSTNNEAAAAKAEYKPPVGAQITGTWSGKGGRIEYTAKADWLLLRRDEKPSAEIFHVSYLADGGGGRPVTFVFNGGPGSSSAFLHMGVVGPQRVAFPPDGTLPRLPPQIVANDDSWLAFTDLVFVDPVATGFSRVVDGSVKRPQSDHGDQVRHGGEHGHQGHEANAPEPEKEYFGYKRDLESLCEFMSRWLSTERRWDSPVFIAGESYGGYRVGRLVRMAQESAGVGFSGAVMISPALELASLTANDYDVLAWVDQVPTMTLAAVHHQRSRAFPAGTPAHEVRREAELFATDQYTTLLTRGASLETAERERIIARLADLIGLPLEGVARAGGRVSAEVFRRELLRDRRLVLGLYDATITAVDPFPDREPFAGPDPTLAGTASVYTAAINHQLRSVLGVKTDREYVLLSYEVNQAWRDDAQQHFFVPPVGATDDFRYGMALNPHLRAFIANGFYDLVTPYHATDRLRNLMRLDQQLADRLTVRHFSGGHMFYAWEQSRHEFTAAIAEFMAGALGG